MDYFLNHPTIFFIVIILAIVGHNWWWAIFFYRDAKERKYKHEKLWAAVGLVGGPWATPLYNAVNQRPTTLLSSDPTEIIAGEHFEKTRKKGRYTLLVIFGLWFAFALNSLFSTSDSLQETLLRPDSINILIFTLFPLIMFIYTLFALANPTKSNPLDRPLWGMKQTPEGNVDESITKHKGTVIFLAILCLSPIIFFVAYVIFNTLTK